MELIESAIAGEASLGIQEAADDIAVLDDITPVLCQGERHAERLQRGPWHCPSYAAGYQGIKAGSRGG